MRYNVCVIGSEALLFPFLQFGFTTFTPSTETELRTYLNRIIEEGYGIIYIEDSYCEVVSDILERYQKMLTPIVIPIGESEDGDSYSKQMVKEMMEKAIGVNVI